MALSEKDIRDANIYLFEIEEYGNYYASLIDNAGKENKVRKPSLDQRLISDEHRAQMAAAIDERPSACSGQFFPSERVYCREKT